MQGARIEIGVLVDNYLTFDIAPHTGSENWNPKCMRAQGVDYTIAPHAGGEKWNSIIFWKIWSLSFSTRGTWIGMWTLAIIKKNGIIAPHAGSVNWNCSEAAHKYHRSNRSLYGECELKFNVPVVAIVSKKSLPCRKRELKFGINTFKQTT